MTAAATSPAADPPGIPHRWSGAGTLGSQPVLPEPHPAVGPAVSVVDLLRIRAAITADPAVWPRFTRPRAGAVGHPGGRKGAGRWSVARPAKCPWRESTGTRETTTPVATAVTEFLTGPLLDNPQRLGKPLIEELRGYHSARRGAYRVDYRIDDTARVVHVVRIDHRAEIYRT